MFRASRLGFCATAAAAATSKSSAAASPAATTATTAKLLMRFPANFECIASLSSSTLVNEQSFLHSSTLRPWAVQLRDRFVHCHRANPTLHEITRISQTLTSLPPDQVQSANVHETVLLLSLCYQTAVTPSDALLSRAESLVPQLLQAANGSPDYLLLVLCCYDFFAPHRLPTVLASAAPLISASVQSLRSAELFLFMCLCANNNNSSNKASTNNAVLPPALFETLLERAVMLVGDFSAREVANLSCAISQYSADFSNSDQKQQFQLRRNVLEALEHDFGKRFIAQQELSTLRDAATMWWSAAVAGVSVGSSETARELHEACARRCFMMLRDTNAECFAKIVCALSHAVSSSSASSVAAFKAPRLQADLAEISSRIDLSVLHPIVALDAACGAAQLMSLAGDDALFARLTSRIVAGRTEILKNEAAREKLLQLAALI